MISVSRIVVTLVVCTHGGLLLMTSAAPLVTPQDGGRHRPNEVTKDSANKTKEEAWNYLKRYGHLRGRWNSASSNDAEFAEGMRSLQHYGGITKTGKLDNATRALFRRPRCGMPDAPISGRRKRFAFSGSKWQKTSLNYRIQTFSRKLKPNVLMSVFSQAFKLWSSVSPLTFSQTFTTALTDIEIKFAAGDHGDGFPFDGPGNILSHTFSPLDGRMHFDEDETWTNELYTGVNLCQVSAHEIGHAIGLGHSSFPGSLMNPFYQPEVRLTQDDVDAVQVLYGVPDNYEPQNQESPQLPTTTTTTTTTTTSTTTTTTPIAATNEVTSSIALPTTTKSTTEAQMIIWPQYTPPLASMRMTPLRTSPPWK